MVSLLIDFVSHLKFLFRFEAKQAKLGGQFRYFAQKISLRFTSVFFRSEIRGHPRAHILSKNMDVGDKDKNSLFILLFDGINVEKLKKFLAFHSEAPQ